ncbi:MAG TPA: YihY/virulence factor BrkB family protein, partial [Thermoleophilia bacterium]
RAWRELVRIVGVVFSHELTQLAAALTYYTVLSLLPALIVVVSLLGLVGLSPDAVHSLLRTLGELGAPWAAQAVSAVLDSVLTSQRSGWVFIGSLILALWAASAYVGSTMAASDRIYEITLRRPFWKSLPLRVGLALLLLLLLSLTAAVVALVGPFGRWVMDVSSIGSGPLHLWTWIKWPLLIVLGLLLFALLYKFTPSRRQPALWWLLPGAAVGVALWIAASAGFSLYLDHFSSYNRVYGTLGAAVAFLVWAWLLNLALLVGVEVNRDVERRRGGNGGAAALPGDAASV